MATDRRSHGAAIAWFPPVGALLGALVILLDTVLASVLPAAVVGPLDLAALALVTGGLHLDGLADSADGLLGGGDRERRLAVMRDPHVGAFAVAAISLTLLVDAAALNAAPSRATALWLAAVCARWAMAVAVWWLPNARADGLGASLRSTVRGPHVVAATVWVAVLALPFGMPGVVAVIAAAATAVVIGLRAVRALGGATGDVYGAVAEVSFASVLVTQVATA